jgi:acetate kinase
MADRDVSRAKAIQVLVLNGGSSSIKFSVYACGEEVEPKLLLDGELSGIGSKQAALKPSGGAEKESVDAENLEAAIEAVLHAIAETSLAAPEAVGYRVVHPGPKLHGHQRVTDEVLLDLQEAAAFAPLHDPEAVQLIRATMKRYPDVPHYVCFDTVFHETMPAEATTYPLPAEYAERGVKRYGFHGLSCESIVRQMRALGELPQRMVIAHLGSGCSVTALVDGRSVDTTMGLTPTGGVVMGTRSGDLDPGLVLYLLRQEVGTAEDRVAAVESLLNHGSGVSVLSHMANDVKAIRAAANEGNEDARLALKVFTRSVTKAIGGFCWLLGGLDAMLFSGGIGEHDAVARGEILKNLHGLGVDIDMSSRSMESNGIQRVSGPRSMTKIFVVPAQEDLMIALHVERMSRAGM